MTLVLGPIHWVAARSAPRAAILPARTAMACAVGAEGFMVTILPLRRTRSAGWAWRHAARAAMRTGTDTRMEFRIQKISGHGARVAKRAFLEWGWRSGESDFDAETRRKARRQGSQRKKERGDCGGTWPSYGADGFRETKATAPPLCHATAGGGRSWGRDGRRGGRAGSRRRRRSARAGRRRRGAASSRPGRSRRAWRGGLGWRQWLQQIGRASCRE